jgi:DNA polymerase (family 10)
MENPEVAQVFEEIADLLELQGADAFRVRAYRNGARVIRDLSQPLAELVGEDGKKLESLAGIGKSLAGKIKTIFETGDLPQRQELRQQVPPGLRDLLNLPGLGPKKAQVLYREFKVSSLDDLRRVAEQHLIRNLAGFGEKTEQKILESLENVEQEGRRVYLSEAKVYAEAVVDHLKKVPGVQRVEVAGSYRRRRETVGDLDVLATCATASSRPGKRSGSKQASGEANDAAAQVMDQLASFEAVAGVLARGDTKMTVRLRNGLQLDLRVVAEESFGAALQYFTGSKAHSIELRRRAQERDLRLNEYGVFRDNKRVAGKTEEEVYESVGLPWIPPELREARGEIELALQGRLPKLLELQDLRGDLHMHTTATDGRASLEEMVEAAQKRGYAYIAITDHSKRVTMARGLDATRLRQHWRAIDKVARTVKGITILKGVELDILENGTLDLPDDVLKEADWVVASIHYGQKQPREQLTRRMLNAIRNPYVHAIGHPTGRLIGRRKPYEIDLETVLKAAADHGCFMELNSQPARLDLDDVALMAAKERGVPIIVSTDAHSVEELGFMESGVYQARRAGLQAENVVNTRSLAQLRKMLKK